ncbi:hypothetical protein Ae201684P_016848 [Aphanomyces euteiches]|nr:hypothetical protein Ae201684P_016848 [Aphanomyces euteiches]
MRLVLALMLALVALAVGAPQVLETIKEHPFDGQKRVTLRDHLKIPMSPPASPRQGFQNLRRHSTPQRRASPERKQSRGGKIVDKAMKCLSKLCRAG